MSFTIFILKIGDRRCRAVAQAWWVIAERVIPPQCILCRRSCQRRCDWLHRVDQHKSASLPGLAVLLEWLQVRIISVEQPEHVSSPNSAPTTLKAICCFQSCTPAGCTEAPLHAACCFSSMQASNAERSQVARPIGIRN